jgi:NtrC-family two-component system sensor histidine kinase KinB
MSLRAKAAVLLGCMGLVPLVAMGTWSQSVARRTTMASVLELHTKVAERFAAEVGAYIEGMQDRMRLALVTTQASRSDWKGIETILRAVATSHADIRSLSIVNPKGRVLLDIESGPPLAQSEDLSQCRGRADPICWSPAAGAAPSVLELLEPMPSGLHLRLTLVPKSLLDAIGTSHIGGTGFALLIDRKGRPVLFPESLTAQRSSTVPAWPIARQALAAGAVGSSLFQDEAGRRQVGAYAPVPAFQGAVLTVQPEAEAMWTANQMRRSLVLVLALAALLAMAAAFWLSRRLARPLLALSQAAAQVAAGSFPETPLLSTGDELQTLSENFRRMVAELKRYSEVQLDRLLEAQRRLEAMLYSIDDGILMTEGSGRLVLANRSAIDMTGLPAGESVDGRRLEDLPLPDEARRALQTALDDPTGPVREAAWVSGGAARTVLISAHPVVLPRNQDLRGVVLALRDVTLEREVERMKDGFLHSITHDLRSPMASIIGFSKYLLKGVGGTLSAEQTEMVATIQDASQRTLALVNDILDLARLEFRKVKLKAAPVRLGDVAERTARTLRGVAQQRGVSFKVELAALAPVEADPELMERLLGNLMGNAAKFARDNGLVSVSGREEGESVELCVADDGDGVPEAFREKIFEKFEQVPGTRKGGLGLGLTICREIVQMHGGRIWVGRELGPGARFFVSLPKRQAAPAGAAPGAGA